MSSTSNQTLEDLFSERSNIINEQLKSNTREDVMQGLRGAYILLQAVVLRTDPTNGVPQDRAAKEKWVAANRVNQQLMKKHDYNPEKITQDMNGMRHLGRLVLEAADAEFEYEHCTGKTVRRDDDRAAILREAFNNTDKTTTQQAAQIIIRYMGGDTGQDPANARINTNGSDGTAVARTGR